MDSDVAGQLIILVILLLLSAFFSSAETAFTGLNKIRIRSQAEEGSKKAALIYKLIDDPSKLLSTILVGNNVVNIAASSLTTALMLKFFGNAAIGLATGILTLLILIFGEITPKTLATKHAERLAYRYAAFFNILVTLLTPITFIINVLASLVIRLFASEKAESATITEQELRTIVDVSEEQGILENDESRMINNVVDFGDTYVKDIMVPSFNMKCVPDNISYDKLISAFRDDQYSRMPVYSGSRDNIVGIVLAKDILTGYDPSNPSNPSKPFNLKTYIRKPYFTFELKNTRELMQDMKSAYVSIAIVLDEYGATAGLVTIEDLIEEIVGEIRDEYDRDEIDAVHKLNDCEYEVSGQLNIDDFNELFDTDIVSDGFDSIAGYVISLLKHLPEMGEKVSDDNGLTFTILALEKRRIKRIHVIKTIDLE